MQKNNIVWLASYPKSGNTWVRFFISSLIKRNSFVDLNEAKENILFSSRQTFESGTDLDSTYLYDEEIKNMLPEVFCTLSASLSKLQFVKVHDAFTLNTNSQPIIPIAPTRCAVYIIRNPLDIAASFASHINRSIDTAIGFMNDNKTCLSENINNHNTGSQIRQLLLNWSEHVNSWTHNAFPTLFIRYEDMLATPLLTFKKIVAFIGIDATEKEIQNSIESTSFSRLQKSELKHGFAETSNPKQMFFRSGTAGNWTKELSKKQASDIIKKHGIVMNEFGYDTVIEKFYS